MKVVAKLNNLRTSPRKVRLVADLVRGKNTEKAQNILTFAKQKSAEPILKLLNQAIANAKNNFQLDPTNLFIARITVDEGPKFKRWRARSRGQAFEIQKKTSHITIILEEVVVGKKVGKKKEVKEAEVKQEEVKEEKKEVKTEKAKATQKFDIRKTKVDPGARRMFRRKAF
ncbi:MAG: 50S ribosomal protein L22 [bacterium]